MLRSSQQYDFAVRIRTVTGHRRTRHKKQPVIPAAHEVIIILCPFSFYSRKVDQEGVFHCNLPVSPVSARCAAMPGFHIGI